MAFKPMLRTYPLGSNVGLVNVPSIVSVMFPVLTIIRVMFTVLFEKILFTTVMLTHGISWVDLKSD